MMLTGRTVDTESLCSTKYGFLMDVLVSLKQFGFERKNSWMLTASVPVAFITYFMNDTILIVPCARVIKISPCNILQNEVSEVTR